MSAVALRRGRTVWAAEAAYQGAEDLERALAALAAERPRGAKRAAVGLSEDVARLKTVEGLPHLSREDLAAHVRLHSRRYFLQNGVPLVTDAVTLDGGRGARRALLAAAPAPLIEAIARGLEAAGIACTTIAPLKLVKAVPRGPGDTFASARAIAQAPRLALALLPDDARVSREAVLSRSVARWAAIAVLSVALAIATWCLVQWRLETQATRELARLRPQLEVALTARADLDATTAALALLARAADNKSYRARFLADLTRALPDSVFLVSVRLEPDGQGWIAGYAPSAAQVVARLERARIVRSAAIEGPVTREVAAGRERERFTIRIVSLEPAARVR